MPAETFPRLSADPRFAPVRLPCPVMRRAADALRREHGTARRTAYTVVTGLDADGRELFEGWTVYGPDPQRTIALFMAGQPLPERCKVAPTY